MQTQNKKAGTLLPPQFQGFELMDPNIIYSIQLVNASARQLRKCRDVIEADEPEKFSGYGQVFDGMAEQLDSVVETLINYAAFYAKASL